MIKIKYVTLVDNVGGDCDCCGAYQAEGFDIYINDNLVYGYYNSGHTGGSQTEGELHVVLMDAIISEFKQNEPNYAEYFSEELEDIKKKEFPYNPLLAVKMICLWLEDEGFMTDLTLEDNVISDECDWEDTL